MQRSSRGRSCERKEGVEGVKGGEGRVLVAGNRERYMRRVA
jgi:hypothetical protein